MGSCCVCSRTISTTEVLAVQSLTKLRSSLSLQIQKREELSASSLRKKSSLRLQKGAFQRSATLKPVHRQNSVGSSCLSLNYSESVLDFTGFDTPIDSIRLNDFSVKYSISKKYLKNGEVYVNQYKILKKITGQTKVQLGTSDNQQVFALVEHAEMKSVENVLDAFRNEWKDYMLPIVECILVNNTLTVVYKCNSMAETPLDAQKLQPFCTELETVESYGLIPVLDPGLVFANERGDLKFVYQYVEEIKQPRALAKQWSKVLSQICLNECLI